MKLKKHIKKGSKAYWFFRSSFISGIIIFCLMLLGIGCLDCYAKMQSTVTGQRVTVLERRDKRIYFLGKDVGSAEFLSRLFNERAP